MEIIVASSIGVLTAGGVYLLLRLRTFPVILGLALLSYAVNVFLFASGRLAIDQSPILSPYGEATYTDPLPQALVLTAIVISFGMTAVLVMIGLGAFLEADSDRIDIEPEADERGEEGQPPDALDHPARRPSGLLAPLIAFVMRHDITLARTASVAGTVALLAIALGLTSMAADGTTHVYRLGDWPAPFGIVLVLDRLSALMVLLTSTLALIVLIHAIATGWDARGRHFHALFQFQLMGICGAFLTGDVFNLFVFFEVLLIASYGSDDPFRRQGRGCARACNTWS
jgi:multisubunit Na+/H+ antiporter MnhC subunit